MYKHGVNIFANILHDFYMNFTLNLINYMSFSYISCIYMERRSGERRAGRAGPGSCGGPTVIVRLAEANRRPGGGLAGLAGGGRAWRGGRRGRWRRRRRGRAAARAARRRPGPETRVSVGVQAEKEWLGSISVSGHERPATQSGHERPATHAALCLGTRMPRAARATSSPRKSSAHSTHVSLARS